MVKGGGLKLEINIPTQHILAKSKGGFIIEGGVSSSEYGNFCMFAYQCGKKKINK